MPAIIMHHTGLQSEYFVVKVQVCSEMYKPSFFPVLQFGRKWHQNDKVPSIKELQNHTYLCLACLN